MTQRGHEAVRVPLLKRLWEIENVRQAALDHPDVDWLIVTSGTTVDVLAAAAPNAWRDARIAAVGPGTARKLVAMGRPADLVPSRHTGAALVRELTGIRRKKVLYPKADLAPRSTAEALEQRGATVVEVVAYRNIEPPGAREALAAVLPVDATLLLSGSAAERLAAAIPSDRTGDLGQVYVIGPTTAAATKKVGLPVHDVADPYSVEGLLYLL